uniref:CXXC-type domain-containing protein n=1 Tax=Macrostomum lignano TaxID=282301 RepID=A0A1I8ID14_9PLAT
PCHHCKQRGQISCNRCKGRRQVKCGECSGQGTKRPRVRGCRGSGEIECPTCLGHKQLLFSIKVKCEWRKRQVDFIEEKTDMPDELVRDVSGTVLFAEEDDSVSPILNFPYAPVNEASARLVAEQDKAVKGQRVIRQRHRLRGVPVAECHFQQHSGGSGVFFRLRLREPAVH